ncbi:MAG: hypothetical protein KGL39_25270 [Patescibacteria group bacterium]|nr:hypothetical protein [Patescibacteria group bacterium]
MSTEQHITLGESRSEVVEHLAARGVTGAVILNPSDPLIIVLCGLIRSERLHRWWISWLAFCVIGLAIAVALR